MTQPVIFISYSHKDEREKDRLLIHLGVLQRQGLIDLWSDDRIGVGASWKQEISEAMAHARVAILLISAKFLTSDFVLGEEVPALLKRRKSEDLTVFPIIAKACAWQEVDWLTEMNVRPKNGRPIWGGRRVDADLADIAKEVAAIVKTSPPIAPTAVETIFHQDLSTLIQHIENDFKEVRGKQDFVDAETDTVGYRSKFSFEYSDSNTIWLQTDGAHYFSCHFYDGDNLQEADTIFTELARRIKLSLANEWRFREKDNPDNLYRKELEAIRRYNTMRIRLRLVAYKSAKTCQVDFWIEKLEED